MRSRAAPSALRNAETCTWRFSSETTMPRPHPAEEVFFCEEQAVGFQQDQKEIEGARADYDRNTVGQQLPPAQQHAETGEFERRVGCCRTRPVCVVLQRI